MAGTTRWVVLDGSSTAFEFSGSWREEAASGVHQTTLQTTTLSGSQMSFSFNGSEMILFGKVRTGDEEVRPRVDCSVDNVPTSPDARATGEDFACWWPTSQDDGPHGFLLNATIPGGSGTSSVSIDSLWFHPAIDSSISDQDMLVMYDNQDPHIQFSPGDWDILEDPEDNGVSSTTNRTGASLSVIFTGTRIVWEGWRAAGSGLGRSNGTFSMDGGPPTSFDINPSSSQQTTKGITIIEVGDLAPGPHNLTVVYNGPSAPLILDHFLVTGGNFRIEGPLESVLPSTSSSPVAPTSSSDSSASPASSSPPVGAIAGGVVGGVVALLLIILVILWTRRRSRNRTALPSLSTNETTSPTPFTGTYSSSHQGFGSPGVTSTSHLSPSIRTSTNGTSLTQINNNNSPAMYRKGLESSQQPETMGEVYQYQDSGVRLPQNGLPPVYTPE